MILGLAIAMVMRPTAWVLLPVVVVIMLGLISVWVYNLPGSEQIGYDYWSRGVTRPDLILADLIKILHPELAADHEFVWYRQVPAE